MKTLYERVLVELVEEPVEKTSLLEGMEKPNEFQKVIIRSWGTNVDGTNFLPRERDNIAYIKIGTPVVPFNDLFIVDRRHVQAFEEN